jgi:hypothetical protein
LKEQNDYYASIPITSIFLPSARDPPTPQLLEAVKEFYSGLAGQEHVFKTHQLRQQSSSSSLSSLSSSSEFSEKETDSGTAATDSFMGMFGEIKFDKDGWEVGYLDSFLERRAQIIKRGGKEAAQKIVEKTSDHVQERGRRWGVDNNSRGRDRSGSRSSSRGRFSRREGGGGGGGGVRERRSVSRSDSYSRSRSRSPVSRKRGRSRSGSRSGISSRSGSGSRSSRSRSRSSRGSRSRSRSRRRSRSRSRSRDGNGNKARERVSNRERELTNEQRLHMTGLGHRGLYSAATPTSSGSAPSVSSHSFSTYSAPTAVPRTGLGAQGTVRTSSEDMYANFRSQKSYSYSREPRRGGGPGLEPCYRCGRTGHIARDCDDVIRRS